MQNVKQNQLQNFKAPQRTLWSYNNCWFANNAQNISSPTEWPWDWRWSCRSGAKCFSPFRTWKPQSYSWCGQNTLKLRVKIAKRGDFYVRPPIRTSRRRTLGSIDMCRMSLCRIRRSCTWYRSRNSKPKIIHSYNFNFILLSLCVCPNLILYNRLV